MLKSLASKVAGKTSKYQYMFLSVVIASSFLAYVYTITSRRLTVNLFFAIANNSKNNLQ